MSCTEGGIPITCNEFFQKYYRIENPELLQEIENAAEFRHLKKGEYLIRIGEPQKDVYFLVTGSFRGFLLDQNGKEVTDCICFKPGIAAMSTSRMEPGVPSPMAIEMLEDGSFFCISMFMIAELQTRYTEITLLYNELLNKSLDDNWKMKQVLAQYTALQRYQWFLEAYPGIIDRINNKYIASFLGMTPVTLSRLRKTIRESQESLVTKTDTVST